MAGEQKRHKITSQAALARLVPCNPVTLSRGKTQKGYLSVEKYEILAQLTNINKDLWAFGSRKKLAAELRAFFKRQKYGY